MSDIHQEFTKRGARLVRRLQNSDVLANRAKFIGARSEPIAQDRRRKVRESLQNLAPNGQPLSNEEIMLLRAQEEGVRLCANREFSRPHWELMKKRKKRDLD